MKVTDQLIQLEREATQGHVLLTRILEVFGDRGHLIGIFLLSVPFLQPIPMMGLSTVLGLITFFISVSLALGRPPWIPVRLRSKSIPGATMIKIVHGARTIFGLIERFIRPRGRFFYEHPYAKRFAGVAIAILALLLALPLPIPGTNAAAAVPMVLISLGVLEEDGFVAVTGYFLGVLSVLFFAALLALPVFGVSILT